MIKSMIFMLLIALPVQAATITVNVNKVKSAQGDIRASLCENEAAYIADKCIKDIVIKAQKGTNQLVFQNIAPGIYGIQLFHDKNGNGDMDFNFLGIPKEGYGLSNNIKPKLSAPPFKKIAFTVTDSNVVQSIDLIN
jgi:uncharacterized protein (DUF2141 family)